MATIIPTIYQTDPSTRQLATEEYIKSGGDSTIWKGFIECTKKTNEDNANFILEESNKQKEANKKQDENKNFFNDLLIAGEMKSLLNEIMMMESQQQLQMELREELEKLEKELAREHAQQNQQAGSQAEKPAASDANKAEKTATEKAIERIEAAISRIDNQIANIHQNWGGTTWQEGLNKNVDKLAKEFGKDLQTLPGLNETQKNLLISESKQVEAIVNDCQRSLASSLKGRDDPNKIHRIVTSSYAAATPGAPAGAQLGPSKAQVTMQFGNGTEFMHFFAAQKLHAALKKGLGHAFNDFNLNVRDLVQFAQKNKAALAEFQRQVTEFTLAEDLIQTKQQLKKIATGLKISLGGPEGKLLEVENKIQTMASALVDATLAVIKAELTAKGIDISKIDNMLNPSHIAELKERMSDALMNNSASIAITHTGITREILNDLKDSRIPIENTVEMATNIVNKMDIGKMPEIKELKEQRAALLEKQTPVKQSEKEEPAPDIPAAPRL